MKILFAWLMILSFLLPVIGLAEESESTIILGVALHDSTIEVEDRNTNEKAKAVTSDDEIDYAVQVQYYSTPSFFGDTKVGYRFALNSDLVKPPLYVRPIL